MDHYNLNIIYIYIHLYINILVTTNLLHVNENLIFNITDYSLKMDAKMEKRKYRIFDGLHDFISALFLLS